MLPKLLKTDFIFVKTFFTVLNPIDVDPSFVQNVQTAFLENVQITSK